MDIVKDQNTGMEEYHIKVTHLPLTCNIQHYTNLTGEWLFSGLLRGILWRWSYGPGIGSQSLGLDNAREVAPKLRNSMDRKKNMVSYEGGPDTFACQIVNHSCYVF